MLFPANITPTVELNALAMKRGEQASYTFVEQPRFPSSVSAGSTSTTFPAAKFATLPPPGSLNFRGIHQQR